MLRGGREFSAFECLDTGLKSGPAGLRVLFHPTRVPQCRLGTRRPA
jgi:hypothetical protein